jgi:hypothetical protein
MGVIEGLFELQLGLTTTQLATACCEAEDEDI